MSIFYYDANHRIYPTQLDAIASNKMCNFYYHDEEMRKYDWKKPPIESLQELYKQRAQQLRDEYEYIILCYSGGEDSMQMLEAFYYNNIHIDEIVTVGAFSQDSFKGSNENRNGDVYLSAMPTLNELHLPKTKITAVDYTEWFNDPTNFTLINTYGNEWIKYTGAYRSLHILFWYDFKKFIGKNNNKKTAYIFGCDKARVVHIPSKNRSVHYFDDTSVNSYGGASLITENFNRINFYSDPDELCIKIIIKQAHTILEYKKYSELDDKQSLSVETGKLIYDLKNPVRFTSNKSKISHLSPRDNFILNKKNSDIFKMFIEGVKILENHTPSIFKHSLPCFSSKAYYLE